MNAAASFRRAFLLLACTLAALAVGQLAAATALARAPRFVVELRISHASESLGGSARSRSIPRSNAAGNASASTTTATAVAVVESRVYDRTTELSGRITIDARSSSAPEEGLSAATNSVDVLANPSDVEGLTPEQVNDLAENAGYDVQPGKASAANSATRYYLPGTNNSEGFRVLPEGVAGQGGVKAGAYLKYFGGPNNGVRVPLS